MFIRYIFLIYLNLQVIVTLATLSFFCHRPTIIAIMEFANAINYEEAKETQSVNGTGSGNFSGPITKESGAEEQSSSTAVQEPAIRALLGKGKSRVIFHLTLNMAKAAIYLMNETGFSIATLSQNNLLTDIKVCYSYWNRECKSCVLIVMLGNGNILV